MSSSFGKRKPVVRKSVQADAPMRAKASEAKTQAAQETLQAFYRITHTEPSRLERARMMRAQYSTAA